jgi:hypothetical protein
VNSDYLNSAFAMVSCWAIQTRWLDGLRLPVIYMSAVESMSPAELTPFRIRIASGGGGRCYIVRAANGAVTYMSAQETPLALSHLVGNEAAELRFQLEDAKDGKAALACLVKVLTAQWAGKPTMQPKPELIQ